MALRRRYYAYRATTFPGFVFPVTTLFLLARGLSFAGIAAAGATAIVVGVVGEVPTGYVADRFGRRNTLLAAAVTHTLAQAGYLFVWSVPAVAVVVSVSALAESLQSGTLDAWLHDVLDDRDESDEYTAVFGRGESVRHYAGAAMLVAAGPVYAADPAYPFYAMTVVNCASAVSLLFLPETDGRADDDSFSMRRAAATIRDALWSPNLRTYVLYAALATAVIRVSMEYLQPVAVDALAFSVVRLPLLLGAGVVADAFDPYVALSAVSATFLVAAGVLWLVEVPIRAGRADASSAD